MYRGKEENETRAGNGNKKKMKKKNNNNNNNNNNSNKRENLTLGTDGRDKHKLYTPTNKQTADTYTQRAPHIAYSGSYKVYINIHISCIYIKLNLYMYTQRWCMYLYRIESYCIGLYVTFSRTIDCVFVLVDMERLNIHKKKKIYIDGIVKYFSPLTYPFSTR